MNALGGGYVRWFSLTNQSLFLRTFVNLKKALLLKLSLVASPQIKMDLLPFIVRYSDELGVIIGTSLVSCAAFLSSSPSKLKNPGPTVSI